MVEAADEQAFFTVAGDDLIPAPHARGPWAADMLHGRLLGGLMARAIEREHAGEDLHVARLTVDLFRRAGIVPLRVTTRRVRDGGRIRVVDATATTADGEVARASAVLLRRGTQPPGEIYSTPGWDAPEPDRLGPPLGGVPFHLWLLSAPGDGTGGGVERTWESAKRRRAWVREAHELIAGESVSPFVRVALAADLTSPLTLFSTVGLRYINADYTLTLGRLPVSEAIGFQSDGQLSDDGVAVARCTLYDSAGPIGHCAVTALAMRRLQ
ncbi:MAG TPA: acyl-CoA thioesterase domain-containing protein [Streptosporangiaceae bacterium]|nr:acyl-CoA thioesterase domain-containing protein [Streptosporangiaceae bacterium]